MAQTDTLDAPFSIVGDNCSGQILAEAESCQLEVRFAPISTGFAGDSFDLPSNDADESSLTINLHGLGVPVEGDGGCFINMLVF